MKLRTNILLLCIFGLVACMSLSYAVWLRQKSLHEQFWLYVPETAFSGEDKPKVEDVVGTWEGLSSRGWQSCYIHFESNFTGWVIEYANGVSNPVSADCISWGFNDTKIRIEAQKKESCWNADCILVASKNGNLNEKILYLIKKDHVWVRYICLPENELVRKRKDAKIEASKLEMNGDANKPAHPSSQGSQGGR